MNSGLVDCPVFTALCKGVFLVVWGAGLPFVSICVGCVVRFLCLWPFVCVLSVFCPAEAVAPCATNSAPEWRFI